MKKEGIEGKQTSKNKAKRISHWRVLEDGSVSGNPKEDTFQGCILIMLMLYYSIDTAKKKKRQTVDA